MYLLGWGNMAKIFTALMLGVLGSCSPSRVATPSAGINQGQKGGGDSSSKTSTEAMSRFVSVSVRGKDNLWAVVGGDLVFTADGGNFWVTVPASTLKRFAAVGFATALLGWAINVDGQLWQTSDGGRTWTLSSKPESKGESLYMPRQIFFVDEQHGWITDAFSIWRTEDGGKSWERTLSTSDLNQGPWQPSHLEFLNSMQGWVACSYGVVHRTTDGGRTWQTQNLTSGKADLRDVLFVDTNTGWVGGPGCLFRSDDGGRNWKRQLDIHGEVNSVYFKDRNEGWVVGRESDPASHIGRPLMLQTSDGGENWRPSKVDEETFFDRIYLTDAQHGWLTSRDKIYRTEDGGQSWRIVLQLPSVAGENR